MFLILFIIISVPNLSYSEYKECQSVFITAKEEIARNIPVSDSDKVSFRKRYGGQNGYVRFVSNLEGTERMDYVFNEVSRLLGKSEMAQLRWQQFQGQVSEFNELKEKILNEDGSVKKEYTEMEGYASFSGSSFSGDMQKAYKNVSAVLEKSKMAQLRWQAFQGQVSEFKKLKEKILNEDGSVKKEYTEMKGYASFSDSSFSGDMQKAYQNVSAVLEKSKMAQLRWQIFQGQVSEFNELKEKILNEDDSVKEQYTGMEGYASFSDSSFSGDMLKAYKNVSAVLEKSKMAQLGWQVFQGQVSEFNELKEKILNEDDSVKEQYTGMEGYASFSDRVIFQAIC